MGDHVVKEHGDQILRSGTRGMLCGEEESAKKVKRGRMGSHRATKRLEYQAYNAFPLRLSKRIKVLLRYRMH